MTLKTKNQVSQLSRMAWLVHTHVHTHAYLQVILINFMLPCPPYWTAFTRDLKLSLLPIHWEISFIFLLELSLALPLAIISELCCPLLLHQFGSSYDDQISVCLIIIWEEGLKQWFGAPRLEGGEGRVQFYTVGPWITIWETLNNSHDSQSLAQIFLWGTRPEISTAWLTRTNLVTLNSSSSINHPQIYCLLPHAHCSPSTFWDTGTSWTQILYNHEPNLFPPLLASATSSPSLIFNGLSSLKIGRATDFIIIRCPQISKSNH